MDGEANRPRLVPDGAENRLADPPGRVGRELEPASVVELGDRSHQTDVALLDEVEQRHASALVLLGDGNDQAEVRLGHVAAGRIRTRLDLLGELDLLLFGEEGSPADLAKVGSERVVRVALTGIRSRARPLLLDAGQD